MLFLVFLISCFTRPWWKTPDFSKCDLDTNSLPPGQWKVSDGTVAKPVGNAKSPFSTRWLLVKTGQKVGVDLIRRGLAPEWVVVGTICFLLSLPGSVFFWRFIYIYFSWNYQFDPENRPFAPKGKFIFQSLIFRAILVLGSVYLHTSTFAHVREGRNNEYVSKYVYGWGFCLLRRLEGQPSIGIESTHLVRILTAPCPLAMNLSADQQRLRQEFCS